MKSSAQRVVGIVIGMMLALVVTTRAQDVQVRGEAADIQYEYNEPTMIYGVILKEKQGTSGATLATINDLGSGKVQVSYSTGGQKLRERHATGRVKNETDALGRKTEYTWTGVDRGFLKTSKDPLGRVTTYDHDRLGNVLTNTAPDGTQQIYTRDDRGRLLSHRDELNRLTVYIRDAKGLVLTNQHADGTFEAWTYNTFGQPLTHRQKNGGL